MSLGRNIRQVILLVAVLLVALPAEVVAQGRAPHLETAVSAQQVEAGRPFTFQLSAMVHASDRVPGTPTLQTPPGIVVRSGPTVMPKTQVMLNGPNIIQQMGIVVTWTLEASRPGRYRVGPASVVWQGRTFRGSLVDVEVVSAGSLPSQRRDPFDMFDIFGLPRLPSMFDEPRALDEPLLPPPDPALAMTAAQDRVVFLRAMVDESTVVLGEQVTLSVYEYRQVSSIRRLDVHEPSTPDFVQHPVLDPTDDPGTRYAEVGSSTWTVRLVRKVALFALRTGSLTIGSMRISYQGRGLRGQEERASHPVVVRVVDAPAKGRPVGYRAGDVGKFRLSADVEPRAVDAGGAVAVRVRLQGSGNLPMTLPTPSAKGVQWLDPEVSDDIEATNGKLRGERVFSYVVRLGEAGTVDLGEIRLPYFDPESQQYEVTTARLGEVTVRANEQIVPEKAGRDRFAELAGPRRALGEAPAGRRFVTDSPYYWLSLLVTPLSVVLVGTGLALGRRIRRSMGSWRSSLDRQARLALDEAERARANGSGTDATVRVERAIHAAIEAATGCKSRGVLRADLAGKLQEQGLDAGLSVQCVALLETCESLRFDPTASDEKFGHLLDDARKLTKVLLKNGKGRS